MVKFGLVIFGSVRLVNEQEILIFLIFLNTPKNGFLTQVAKFIRIIL